MKRRREEMERNMRRHKRWNIFDFLLLWYVCLVFCYQFKPFSPTSQQEEEEKSLSRETIYQSKYKLCCYKPRKNAKNSTVSFFLLLCYPILISCLWVIIICKEEMKWTSFICRSHFISFIQPVSSVSLSFFSLA